MDAELRVIVMGVSGCGKSTLGRALAERLGARFVEGDELHPPANVERMRSGVALTDADRWPWLDAVAAALHAAPGAPAVASCSALRRVYRDRLRVTLPGLRFVWLHGEETLLAGRLKARRGHYMPAALLGSQLQALEAPTEDEEAIALDSAAPVEVQLAAALAALGAAREVTR